MDSPETDRPERHNRRIGDNAPTLTEPNPDYFPSLIGTNGNGKITKELRKQLHVLVALTVVLYAIMGATAWWILFHQSINTHALCEVRRASQYHMATQQALLKDNPRGVLGLTPQILQAEIDQYYTIVVSLRGVSNDC